MCPGSVHPDLSVKLREILQENQRLFLKIYCSQKTLTFIVWKKSFILLWLNAEECQAIFLSMIIWQNQLKKERKWIGLHTKYSVSHTFKMFAKLHIWVLVRQPKLSKEWSSHKKALGCIPHLKNCKTLYLICVANKLKDYSELAAQIKETPAE